MNRASLADLTDRVLRHRDERQWAQFHTPKELAISLCVESAEPLSLMQGMSGPQAAQAGAAHRAEIQDELADVLHSVLLLAAELKIDLGEALPQKLAKD